MDYSGRLVVITGIGRPGQTGEVLALNLAQRGATLALVDRTQERAEARASDLLAAGFTASAHGADLSNVEATNRLAAEIDAVHGARFGHGVHAVVCAAGGFAATGQVDETPLEEWEHLFSINLLTAFHTTRVFLPAVRRAQGAFVYFTSIASLPQGSPRGTAAYAAAKSGVLTLMRAVAVDEREHGVRANAIAPGNIRTASNEESMGTNKKYVERESVADVVAFLASPLAQNISGQVITLI